MCAAWVLFCHSALRLFTCVSTRTARKHTNLAICNIAWVGNNSRFSQAKKKQFSRKHIFLVLLHFTSSYEYDTLYWMGRKSKKNIVSHLTISTRLININRTWVVWQQRPEKICLSFRQKKSGRQETVSQKHIWIWHIEWVRKVRKILCHLASVYSCSQHMRLFWLDLST